MVISNFCVHDITITYKDAVYAPAERADTSTLPLFDLYPIYTLCPPDILKSNTVTHFKIISGLRNNVQYQRRLPVCRNQQFEEGYWNDFHYL